MDYVATEIGRVRKPEDGSIFIEIGEKYWDATLQLTEFSHIIVLWWITGRDTTKDRSNLQNTPPKQDAPLSGVFASRSPSRPTPIGISTVAILGIDAATKRILIDQIDARDDTPVVDIKPYMPFSDKVDRARVPAWFHNNVARYTRKPLD
jgi:tRNA-Thr(GGU) m(6)t(6)A37 methyltransferase TsaA